MIKKYDIISLNNHLYMVDGTDIKEGEWGVFKAFGDAKVKKAFSDSVSGIYRKILASTDTTLGLPLLPKVEEETDWEYAFSVVFPAIKNVAKHDADNLKDGFMEGYKAASVKKYTEEDIIKLLKYIREYEDFYQLVDEELLHIFVPSYTKEHLTPKPIAVEVEIEDWRGDGEDPEIGNHRKDLIFPKTKDNIVVIKKWIYDKETEN